MPDVARSIIVGGGIGDAAPFATGFIPVISSVSPPEVTDSYMEQVSFDSRNWIELHGDTVAGFLKRSDVRGITLRGEGSGSDSGIFLVCSGSDGGIYASAGYGPDGATPQAVGGGILISQGANYAANGIWLLDEATDPGSPGIYLQAVNNAVRLSAGDFISIDSVNGNTITDTGTTGISLVADDGGVYLQSTSAEVGLFGNQITLMSDNIGIGGGFEKLYLAPSPGFALIAELQGHALGTAHGAIYRISDGAGGIADFGVVAAGYGAIPASIPFIYASNTDFDIATGVTPKVRVHVENGGRIVLNAPDAAQETLTVNGFGGAGQHSIRLNGLTNGAGALVGTLNNSPVAGDPTFWVPISIAGVVKYFPVW